MTEKKHIALPWFIEELVESDVQITIIKNNPSHDDALQYYFDLNLRAKSHLHVHLRKDGEWEARMRYDYACIVEHIDDLIWCAKLGMYGRDYIDSAWAKLIEGRA